MGSAFHWMPSRKSFHWKSPSSRQHLQSQQNLNRLTVNTYDFCSSCQHRKKQLYRESRQRDVAHADFHTGTAPQSIWVAWETHARIHPLQVSCGSPGVEPLPVRTNLLARQLILQTPRPSQLHLNAPVTPRHIHKPALDLRISNPLLVLLNALLVSFAHVCQFCRRGASILVRCPSASTREVSLCLAAPGSHIN